MSSILKSEYTREEIQNQEAKSYGVHKEPQTQVSVEEKHAEKVTKKADDKPKGLARLNMKTERRHALVVYDYWAHNNKELTIRAGEKVLVSWNLVQLFIDRTLDRCDPHMLVQQPPSSDGF